MRLVARVAELRLFCARGSESQSLSDSSWIHSTAGLVAHDGITAGVHHVQGPQSAVSPCPKCLPQCRSGSGPMFCYESESECDEVEFDGVAPPAPNFTLLDATSADLKVAVVRSFLSAKDIHRIHALARHKDVRSIDDRSDDLVYKHEVWRLCTSI